MLRTSKSGVAGCIPVKSSLGESDIAIEVVDDNDNVLCSIGLHVALNTFVNIDRSLRYRYRIRRC